MEGLRITWGNGSISVRPTDAPLVTVTEYAARPLEESELLGLTFSGDTLEVSWDGGLLPLGAFQGWEKRVEVEVPRAVLAQLEELSCWNLSGSMTVEDVGAQKASLTSFRGDLSLSRVQCGELRLSTVSGIVQLARSAAQELSVETDSGGAGIQSVQAGECRLKSVTGPVSFVESAAVELTIQTVSGRCSPGWRAVRKRRICVLSPGTLPWGCGKTMALTRPIPVCPAGLPPISSGRRARAPCATGRADRSFPLPPPGGIWKFKG